MFGLAVPIMAGGFVGLFAYGFLCDACHGASKNCGKGYNDIGPFQVRVIYDRAFTHFYNACKDDNHPLCKFARGGGYPFRTGNLRRCDKRDLLKVW